MRRNGLNSHSDKDLEMRVSRKTCRAMALAALVVLADATGGNAQVLTPPSSTSSQVPAQIKPAKKTAAPHKPCTLPGISVQRLQEILDASSTLQPPLASDAMIQVAAKVASSCSTLAKDLLQRAFDHADSVEPEMGYKLSSWNEIHTDTRLYFQHQTYALQQDRLSLQSRAVLAMATLDAKLAIQLFQRLTPPRPRDQLRKRVCTRRFNLLPGVGEGY